MTEEIKSWDIPETENIDVGGAKAIISKITADSLGDSNHPLRNQNHPQREEIQSARTAAFEVIAKQNAAEKEAFLNSAPEDRPNQKKLVKEAEKIAAELVEKYGYKPTTIPSDIRPRVLRALKQQVMAAEGKFGYLNNELAVDIRQLRKGLPPEISELYAQYRSRPTSEIANDLIQLIVTEKAQRGFIL